MDVTTVTTDSVLASSVTIEDLKKAYCAVLSIPDQNPSLDVLSDQDCQEVLNADSWRALWRLFWYKWNVDQQITAASILVPHIVHAYKDTIRLQGLEADIDGRLLWITNYAFPVSSMAAPVFTQSVLDELSKLVKSN